MKEISIADINYRSSYISVSVYRDYGDTDIINIIMGQNEIKNFQIDAHTQKVICSIRTKPIYNKPNKVFYNRSNLSLISYIAYDSSSWYRPTSLSMNCDQSIHAISWDLKNSSRDITHEVNDWLKEKNIVLSIDNHEIPDEHKAEFKIRFL